MGKGDEGWPGGPYGTCLRSWVRAQLHLHALGRPASPWRCRLGSGQGWEGAWENRQAVCAGPRCRARVRGAAGLQVRTRWLAAQRLHGGLTRLRGDRLDSQRSKEWHFGAPQGSRRGLSGNATPAQLHHFLGPAPGGDGSGNSQTRPFHLHFGSPACARSQPPLSLSTHPKPSPAPGCQACVMPTGRGDVTTTCLHLGLASPRRSWDW